MLDVGCWLFASAFFFGSLTNPRRYVFCHRGVLKNSGCSSCRTGESGATLRTSWYADQQVGFREMLEDGPRSYSPYLRMSTGAKHLHGDRPEYLSACKRLARFSPVCTTYRGKYEHKFQ